MAMFLNLSTSRDKYSDEENKIIEEYYPKEGCLVCKRLQNRSKSSILQQACLLGITYNNPRKWQEEEIDILKRYYSEEGRHIVDRLPKRTLKQIQTMATRFGLKCNGRGWNEKQTQVIKEEYSKLGGKGLVEKYPGLFTNKKVDTLCTYAKNLGLKMDRYRINIVCIELNKVFYCLKDAAQFIGKSSSTILYALKDQTKTVGGYHWKYIDEEGEEN